MYALIDYKGKQYKAEKDALIQVDKIDLEKGQKLNIDTVILLNNDKTVSVGTPYVKGAVVEAVIEDTFRDKKVIVYKEKRKKDYHRTIGHRQSYTNIRITGIKTGSAKASAEA
ncbi:MAG: 50S ribosomal protein L21 [Spirochaetales bacterium]